MDTFLEMSIETRFDLYMNKILEKFMGQPIVQVEPFIEKGARDTMDAIAMELDFKVKEPLTLVWAKGKTHLGVTAVTSVGTLKFEVWLNSK